MESEENFQGFNEESLFFILKTRLEDLEIKDLRREAELTFYRMTIDSLIHRVNTLEYQLSQVKK